MANTMKQAHREGQQDYTAWTMNTREVANPYREGTDEWRAYNAGWEEGKQVAREEYELMKAFERKAEQLDIEPDGE